MKPNIIRAGIIIVGLSFYSLLQFTQCKTPFIMPVDLGAKDTLIINCDTIIFYKKFRY